MSVVVTTFVPGTVIVAPMIGSPTSFTSTPLHVTSSAAASDTIQLSHTAAAVRRSLFNIIDDWLDD